MQKQIPIRTRKNVFNDSEECIAKLEFALVAGTTLLRTFKEPLNVHWHLQTLAHHFSLSHWQSETGSQSKTRSTVTKTISLVPECNNKNPPPQKKHSKNPHSMKSQNHKAVSTTGNNKTRGLTPPHHLLHGQPSYLNDDAHNFGFKFAVWSWGVHYTSSSSLFGMHHQCVAPLACLFRASLIASS